MVMEVHISNTDRVRGFLSAHATLIGFVSTILTISSQSFDFMENSCKEVMLEISSQSKIVRKLHWICEVHSKLFLVCIDDTVGYMRDRIL